MLDYVWENSYFGCIGFEMDRYLVVYGKKWKGLNEQHIMTLGEVSSSKSFLIYLKSLVFLIQKVSYLVSNHFR